MTRPKGEVPTSEKRAHAYSSNTVSSAQKRHSIKHEELNRWFLVWGIIGERRITAESQAAHKYVFDRGPGLGRRRIGKGFFARKVEKYGRENT